MGFRWPLQFGPELQPDIAEGLSRSNDWMLCHYLWGQSHWFLSLLWLTRNWKRNYWKFAMRSHIWPLCQLPNDLSLLDCCLDSSSAFLERHAAGWVLTGGCKFEVCFSNIIAAEIQLSSLCWWLKIHGEILRQFIIIPYIERESVNKVLPQYSFFIWRKTAIFFSVVSSSQSRISKLTPKTHR